MRIRICLSLPYGSGFKKKFFLDTDGCDDEEANGIVYTEQTEVLTNTAPEEKVKLFFTYECDL